MATLKDVANLACVDVSTVSRALNNTSYVHPDTKKRIYDAAKELGYHPNAAAKALRQGKRHAIGVVVPKLHITIFSEILQGIEKYAREHSYSILICVTEDDPTLERDCLIKLRNGFVDGIIIAATGKNGRLIRDIKASGIAVVQLVRRQEYNISSVDAEFEASGYNAVQYLYEKGCQKIGIIAGAQHLYPYKGRYDGYKKAIKYYHLQEYVSECQHNINSFEYGLECATQLISDIPDIDAIIACVDVQGLGALRAIKEAGKDTSSIKVISLTGHKVGNMLETSMTSMEMPAEEMGIKAAQMIIEDIESPSNQKPAVQHLTVTFVLKERETT